MYGVEAQTGVGGLAAQVPGGWRYAADTLRIRQRATPLIGGPMSGTGSVLPFTGLGDIAATPQHTPTSQEVPAGRMLPDWRQLFDFHNSPAPWLLVAVLLLHSWVHVSYRRRGGRP